MVKIGAAGEPGQPVAFRFARDRSRAAGMLPETAADVYRILTWLDEIMRSRSHSYNCVTIYNVWKSSVSGGPVISCIYEQWNKSSRVSRRQRNSAASNGWRVWRRTHIDYLDDVVVNVEMPAWIKTGPAG